MENKPTYRPKRYSLKYRGIRCLNCDHPLDVSDKYCPNCSQINSTKKVTFFDLINEFFATLISYDSKLRKTLSALIFNPGKISIDYINGKRLTYTNPFRFFLSITIIYFIIISFTGNFSDLDRFGTQNNDNVINFGSNKLVNWSGLSQNEKKNLQEALNNIPVDSVLEYKKKKDSLAMIAPKVYFDSVNKKNFTDRFFSKIDFFISGINEHKFYTYNEALDFLEITDSYENKASFGAAGSFLKISRQPGTFLGYLISKIPFIIFFFLPLFAVFIWLLYDKNHFNYMDHLIFGFHNQTMLILLLTIALLMNTIFNIDILWISVLLFLFYLYKAMKNFYNEGRIITIIKYTLLNVIFFSLAFFVTLFYSLAVTFTY
ncbi:DUF3667 domain-containing protein [Abyssalbus ytuae]|uniref:DUF3667 domain-containing protein n=1 Tax=Abyssalbus ytuae TaxID=2926907 RepID=A0A9E6ZP97_9FLAO|nr:DUF3667 domain-containing protein [Abyssalbus ytuae]UOB18364.1 DUF3667 domain-containing protein [Abyssalbus ytuae]